MSAKEKTSLVKVPQNMDDIITGLGVGPWNYLYFTVAALGQMTFTVNLLGAEFMAPPLDFTCLDPSADTKLNSSECSVQSLATNSTPSATVPCSNFLYDNSTYISTLTAEFDMVCSRERLKELFQILFTVGCMVGCPMGGIISDRYGRQTAVFYGSLLASLSVFVMTAVPYLPVIMAARFFVGLFFMVYDNPSYTIGMEACPIKYRSIFGVTVALPYAVMVTALAGIAWVSRRWRIVQLAGSVPLFLLVILSSPCVLRKSARWLVSQGRLEEVEADIKRAATLNKSTFSLPEDLQATLQVIYKNQSLSEGNGESSSECKSLGSRIGSLLDHPSMRRVTVVIVSVWLFQSALYISMPLRSDVFESPFIFVALLGVAEIPAYTVTGPITDKVGRKPFIIGCFLLTAAVETTLMILVLVGMGASWASIVVSSLGYTFICSAFQVNFMYCSELFPTTVRSLGSSMVFFMSSVGYNLPPLMETILPKEMPWVSLLIYGIMSCIAAGLVLLLPETNRKPLMQSVQEHINYTEEKKNKKKEKKLNKISSGNVQSSPDKDAADL